MYYPQTISQPHNWPPYNNKSVPFSPAFSIYRHTNNVSFDFGSITTAIAIPITPVVVALRCCHHHPPPQIHLLRN